MIINEAEFTDTPEAAFEPFLRPAAPDDIPPLLEVYGESIRHGNNTVPDSTEWSITEGYLGKLIGDNELYCMQSPTGLVGAVRLTEAVNPLEWPNGNENRLLIAKLATADAVRGQGFVPNHFLPAIEQEAGSRGMIGTRLNCMADNPGLMRFYGRMFELHGVVSFDSPTRGHPLKTAKFQRDFRSASDVQ